MKKKIILGCLGILFLSGCSVDYNLEITEDSFKEESIVKTDTTIEPKEEFNGTLLVDLFKNVSDEYNYEPIYFDNVNDNYLGSDYALGTVNYTVNTYAENNYVGYRFSHLFDNKDIVRSNAIKRCFEELSIQNHEGYVMLKTNNKCDLFDLYPLLDNLNIRIKTDLEVIVSNADNVNNNVYIWNINRDNYNNKSIHLTYALPSNVDKDEDKATPEKDKDEGKEKEVENTKNGKYNIFLILGSMVILGVVIFATLKYKKK